MNLYKYIKMNINGDLVCHILMFLPYEEIVAFELPNKLQTKIYNRKLKIVYLEKAVNSYVDGVLHRDGDEPAVINVSNSEQLQNLHLLYPYQMYREWYQYGKLHRLNAPAKIASNYVEYYKNGQLHRDGGPAREVGWDSEYWFQNGELHRDDGPAVIWHDLNNKKWYQRGKLHRLDGPAIIDGDYHIWFKDGEQHREDGPAVYNITNPDNDLEYWLYGKLHRSDGPAIIHADGTPEYWLNGVEVPPF